MQITYDPTEGLFHATLTKSDVQDLYDAAVCANINHPSAEHVRAVLTEAIHEANPAGHR